MHENVTPELLANAKNDEDPLVRIYGHSPGYYKQRWSENNLLKKNSTTD